MFKHWFSDIRAKEKGKDTTTQKRAKQVEEVDKRGSWWSLRPLGEPSSGSSTRLIFQCASPREETK